MVLLEQIDRRRVLRWHHLCLIEVEDGLPHQGRAIPGFSPQVDRHPLGWPAQRHVDIRLQHERVHVDPFETDQLPLREQTRHPSVADLVPQGVFGQEPHEDELSCKKLFGLGGGARELLLIFDTPSPFPQFVALFDPNPLAGCRRRWNNARLVAHIVEEGRDYFLGGRPCRHRFGLDLLVAELLDDAARDQTIP